MEKEAELAEAKTYIQDLLDREASLDAALVELTVAMAALESDVMELIGEIESQELSGRRDMVHIQKPEDKLRVAWI